MDDEKTRMYEILKDIRHDKMTELLDTVDEATKERLTDEYAALCFALVLIESEGIT